MTPGPASIGFISNIEGILSRFEKIIEDEYKDSEDDETKKHAKNLLKKIRKVKFGDVPLKIIIEDPSGNSAIISQKAKIEKIKK
jgi:zinc finger protein